MKLLRLQVKEASFFPLHKFMVERQVFLRMAIWESYCNALHEAMSQGCVCIVSKDTASEELIKDGINGFSVPEFNAAAVASKISYIIDPKNKAQIDTMRQRNIAFTKGHSWQEISAQVEKFYTDII